MNLWVDGLSWICLIAGGLFCVLGAVGLVRMPDFYTRMHAASVIETLGVGLILLGLLLQAGFTLVAVKLLIIGLLIKYTIGFRVSAEAETVGIDEAEHKETGYDFGSFGGGGQGIGNARPAVTTGSADVLEETKA